MKKFMAVADMILMSIIHTLYLFAFPATIIALLAHYRTDEFMAGLLILHVFITSRASTTRIKARRKKIAKIHRSK